MRFAGLLSLVASRALLSTTLAEESFLEADPLLAVPAGGDDECAPSPATPLEPGCGLDLLQRRRAAQSSSLNVTAASPAAAAVPPGVNLGGWLVLEDWFFSGNGGRHVMSQGNSGQGACLPPLLTSSAETWPSEGILTKRLQDARGVEETSEIFEAHRKYYITDIDLEQIASLGVRQVRLPLPWSTFADALSPLDAGIYNAEAKIVPDPFYSKEVSFVTVDREWLRDLLGRAAGFGLQLVLDIHYMPGGSSDGTYNGIWPLPPKFWTDRTTVGEPGVPLTEVGLWITEAFVKWLEGLGEAELGAVGGVTLLNEPAHMASIDKNASKPFTLGERQVLDWVGKTADMFRQSSLPGKGVKLYVNMVEPAFDNFWETVAPWYMEFFTQEERRSWAVFDIHWYTAWAGPTCSGRSAPGGRYLCSQPVEEVRPMLQSCIEEDMAKFDRKVDGLKACSEFSVGTFEDPVLACHEKGILDMYLEEQLTTFKRFGIEGFFWTWRMPYGANFESAWSYKRIAGLEAPRDDFDGMCKGSA